MSPYGAALEAFAQMANLALDNTTCGVFAGEVSLPIGCSRTSERVFRPNRIFENAPVFSRG
jgi:hypothetical protein